MASDTRTSVAPVHRFILLTDIAQSSRLAEQYGRLYLAALEMHNKLVEQTVAKCGGEVYKQTGDGYLVLFKTAGACLEAALELGEVLEQLEPLAEDEPLLVRLALHAGELRPSGPEYFGPALNRVSRICQVCNPGQVLLSDAIKAAIPRPLDGFTLLGLGQHHLRDLAEPEQLYQLDSERFSRHGFPSLATLDNRPNNLVEQPNAFIGRECELKELAELLLDGKRLVSITAPGGYGKSRLAAQLCANLLHRFENGVFMVYLAPVRESLDVPTAIANALGYQFSVGHTLEQQLCDYLRAKELLLCLDNFEHVMDSTAIVQELRQAAPQLKLIITSREPLRLQGEHVFRLEPLPVEAQGEERYSEAVRLFADRAALVKQNYVLSAENAAQVQHFCEHLAGIPLAIEMAAAWMDSFTLDELHDELTDQLELEARTSDREPRHQSLKASLDWSWNLLGEQLQETLMRLAVFRGGFFSEAASAVLNMQGMALRGTLARLADKSWLYAREVDGLTRFFLRDAVAREYAFDKLHQSEIFETAVLSHAEYFSALMAKQGPRLHGDGTPTGQVQALRSIEREYENIDEAFDTLQNRLQAEGLYHLLLPIARWLHVYMSMVSSFTSTLKRYELLHSTAIQRGGDNQLRFVALHACGVAELRQGSINRGRDLLQAAGDLAERLGDRCGVAACLVDLCAAYRLQGNLQAALEKVAEASAMRQDLGDQYLIAALQMQLGGMSMLDGDADAAYQNYREAQTIFEEIGDRNGMAEALNRLSSSVAYHGGLSEARRLNVEALAVFRELGNRDWEARCLAEISNFAKGQGDYPAAREACMEALALARETGNRNLTAHILINLSVIDLEEKRHQAAHEQCSEALALGRQTGEDRNIRRALHCLGISCQACGAYSEALDYYAEALEMNIDRRDGYMPGILVAIGTLMAALGKLESAAVCLYFLGSLEGPESAALGPLEREQHAQGRAEIEHPQTGLPPEQRECLWAQARTMSLSELAAFALAELGKLKAALSEGCSV